MYGRLHRHLTHRRYCLRANLALLIRPLCDVDASSGRQRFVFAAHGNCNLYVTSPLDGLALRVKIAVFGGFAMALPVILFQVWRFVTPGSSHGRRDTRYLSSPPHLCCLSWEQRRRTSRCPMRSASWNPSGAPISGRSTTPFCILGLITLMMTLFGLTFQFPVVLVSLELVCAVSPARLLRSWRWAVIAIVVVAGVTFHPESHLFSMLALALPLVVFYFISIAIGKLFGR